MSVLQRKFAGKDVEMLTSAATMLNAAIDNKAKLIQHRPGWVDPFFPNLVASIDAGFQIVGVNNKQILIEATGLVLSIFKDARKELSTFKTMVVEDFKKDKTRRDQILSVLGFTKHLKSVQSGDQEAMVQLLITFSQNLTPALETEILAKGMGPALPTAIKGYSDQIKKANIDQETLKGKKKELTSADVTVLNNIYDDVMSVANISKKLFAGEPDKVALFTYATILARLRPAPEKKDQPAPPVA